MVDSAAPKPLIACVTHHFNIDGILLRAAIAALLLTLAACGGGGGSDEPPPPGLQPTLASIQANVFTPSCAYSSGCHQGPMAQQGLRLDDGFSRTSLVGVTSTQYPMYLRVNSGMPDVSLLILKLEGAPNIGDRMPADGNYLQQATVQVIREWISNGAP